MGVDFGHLAGSAAFDVFRDIGFHVWPPVVGCNELEGFGNSGVASSFLVMEKGNYSPPKRIVCHDNQGGSMVPVSAVE